LFWRAAREERGAPRCSASVDGCSASVVTASPAVERRGLGRRDASPTKTTRHKEKRVGGKSENQPRTRTKLPINVNHGAAPGRVVLDAKALPKPVHYRWQMSTDQTTWTDLPGSFLTKSIVEGLAPATVYSFRLKTMTRNSPSEWSPPVTMMAY
jgi:hypothetical protein